MPLKVDAITSVNGTSDAITIDANSQVTLGENLTVSKMCSFNGCNTEKKLAMPANDIEADKANYFTKTINGNTTFTISGIPASPAVYSFTLEVTHTSGTITWFANVEWNGATPPTLTAGKTHLFMFITDDGGTRWRGAALVDYNN